MGFNTPVMTDWDYGDLITSALIKTYILDNLNYLNSAVSSQIIITAAGMWPTITYGCAAVNQIETAVNKNSFKVLDFSAGYTVASHSATFDVDNGSNRGTITAGAGTPYVLAQAGDTIVITGTADNNGTYIIYSATGTVITTAGIIAGADGVEAATVVTTMDEHAQCTIPSMPSDWDGGTLTAKFIWTANDATTNAVVWEAYLHSFADNEALDTAWGTPKTVTDANGGVAYVLRISGATAVITPVGSPAAGELLHVDICRLATDAADTLAVDARLLGVIFTYTRT